MRWAIPASTSLVDPELVHLADGVSIPRRFCADYVPPALPTSVTLEIETVEGRPACVALTIRAADGQQVNATTLRELPLADLVRGAVVFEGKVIELKPNGTAEVRPAWWRGDQTFGSLLSPERQKDIERAHRAYSRASRRRQRPSRELTDEFLREVAGVYRDALRAGERPVVAVSAKYDNAPIETARRWVWRARQAGHLPPASRGKAAA